jgi:AcrR family transcriptional regulator
MTSFEKSPFVLRPQQERSRIALARIIAGAAKVLVREDSDSFSMAEIAEAAGLPVGSIYRRFKGKESIIQAISLDTFTRLEDIIRDRMQGVHFANAGEVVAELTAGMVAMSEQNGPLFQILVRQSTSNYAVRATVITGRLRLVTYYKEAVSGFLQHIPEQRRDILIGISYHIVASAVVSKLRGEDPTVSDLPWSDLAQEVTKAATGYLEKAV